MGGGGGCRCAGEACECRRGVTDGRNKREGRGRAAKWGLRPCWARRVHGRMRRHGACAHAMAVREGHRASRAFIWRLEY